jgi:hypothetical protein
MYLLISYHSSFKLTRFQIKIEVTFTFALAIGVSNDLGLVIPVITIVNVSNSGPPKCIELCDF